MPFAYYARLTRAAVETLKDYPWVNGEIRGDQIVTRPYVNIGFAVATFCQDSIKLLNGCGLDITKPVTFEHAADMVEPLLFDQPHFRQPFGEAADLFD